MILAFYTWVSQIFSDTLKGAELRVKHSVFVDSYENFIG